MNRTPSRSAHKEKKSYTLSPESVAFLETMRKKRHAGSISAILEEILQSVRRAQERASIERAVVDYYSKLSSEEAAEQVMWGEFALVEFPREERA